MVKTDRRIRDFSSGIKNLSNDSQNYIHKLSHILLLIEKLPVHPIMEKEEKISLCVVDMPEYK